MSEQQSDTNDQQPTTDTPKAQTKKAPAKKAPAKKTAEKKPAEKKPAAKKAPAKKTAAKKPAPKKAAAPKSADEAAAAPKVPAKKTAAKKVAAKKAPAKKPAPKKVPASKQADAAVDETDSQAVPHAPAAPKKAAPKKAPAKKAAPKKATAQKSTGQKTADQKAPAQPEPTPALASEASQADAPGTATELTAEPTTAQAAPKSSQKTSEDTQRQAKPENRGDARNNQPKQQQQQNARKVSPPQKGDAEDAKRKRKMFLSVLPGELMELVLTEDGRVQEYYVEMLRQQKTKGNIYKGYIHNIDASLQAAFINYGAERNGFLQIDEVHPDYYTGGFSYPRKSRYPLIQDVLKPGQELLVQVVKEPTGKKGAFLTTNLSLPGRYFVLTPGQDQSGVSRKIEEEAERKRLKDMIEKIEPGEGMGLIVRTASTGQTQTALKKDVEYLKRLFRELVKRGQTEKAPSRIYHEMDLAGRAVRDYLTDDVSEVWVDDTETADQVRDLVALTFPRRKSMVKLYENESAPLFERFNLTQQIDEISSRTVSLPSGGQLVIDPTEALTAIDINSGKSGGKGGAKGGGKKSNFKDTAYRTNTEAAEEIARQLKLRDIGGQVVVDFIEMRDKKHEREVEKTMRAALKGDRARTDASRISQFGLMQIVRQRMGSSSISLSLEPCPCCTGTGLRRTMEWQSQRALKAIHQKSHAIMRSSQNVEYLEHVCDDELAAYLSNEKREKLTELEEHAGLSIHIIPQSLRESLRDSQASEENANSSKQSNQRGGKNNSRRGRR